MITVLPLLLLLQQNFQTTEGAPCPDRVVYIPEQTLGVPRPNIQLVGSNQTAHAAQLSYTVAQNALAVGQPGDFHAECCSRGRIVNWTVTTTRYYEDIARVNATCSDGERISTPLFGYNGTEQVSGTSQPKFCGNDSTNPGQDLFQSDDEGVFPYQSHSWVTNFMGVGNNRGYFTYTKGAVSCPAGSRTIGVGARSGCYGILALQVVCARTNDTQNNLDGVLNRDRQCSAYTSTANSTSLVDPRAWNETENNMLPMFSAAANETLTECCPAGEGLATWTIADAPYTEGEYTGLTGLIQGTCTDKTVLTAIKYGFNGTGSPVCNQQQLSNVHHFKTPLTQRFYYSITSHLLTSFMSPPSTPGIDLGDRSHLECPPGQGAVGYSAASSCYSLSNISVLCGMLSPSARQTLLDMNGTASDNPPADGDAAVCAGGMSMEPNATFASTDFESPIGKIGAWRIDPIPDQRNNPGVTIYSASASSLSSVCCPRGQAIVAFDVWSVSNINKFVGKVSAVCSSYLDGREPTITSALGHGFNGTSLDGTVVWCPNSTLETATKFLQDGIWSYRANEGFTRLMEWPERNAENSYWGGSQQQIRSCRVGQKPLGFAARSSCWGLADFRVICGAVDLKSNESPSPMNSTNDVNVFGVGGGDGTTGKQGGLSAGGKAGIAVGVAIPVVAAILGFLFYKRCQKTKAQLGADGSIGRGDSTKSTKPIHHHEKGKEEVDEVTTSVEDSKENCIGPTEVPFSEGLSRMEFWQQDSLSVSAISSRSAHAAKLQDMTAPFQHWKIEPSHLSLLYHDNKPIVLGEGGFGTVLLATYCGTKAAVKIVKGGTPQRQEEFLKEIRTLEKSRFRHIVQFYGLCVCEDKLCLVMEYMDGKNLRERIKMSDKNMQWHKSGSNIINDISSGLKFLHSRGIAHLDLKSPNILLCSNGTAKIGDVALGRLVNGMHAEFTAPNIESPAWCAPERRQGKCGLPSDIYAFGTIMWEVCTLQRPPSEGPLGKVNVPQEAPEEVAKMIEKCRCQDPAERPTITELCDQLTRLTVPQQISVPNS